MITTRQVWLYLLTLFFTTSLFAANQTFILDKQHTYVQWRIQHLGFSTQTGKWYAQGVLTLDKDDLKKSTVNATIDLANIITGIPELDKHLKEKMFFDVETYPKATYISNKVETTSDHTATVYGTLTLRGVSKPVALKVTFNKIGKNPINDKTMVGFTATTTIKRSEFGITAFLPHLGDDVTLDINAEAYLKE